MVYSRDESLAAVPSRPDATGCTATGCALGGVKLYADGALGSRGAWLKQPYADKPETRGLQFLPMRSLRTGRHRGLDGFQVAIHAIGDAANAQVICDL